MLARSAGAIAVAVLARSAGAISVAVLARTVGAAIAVAVLARTVGAAIAVRSGTAGTGIGNDDRAPGTHQQARCEHANTCSEAQTQHTHLLLPTSHRRLAGSANVCQLSHSPTIAGIGQQAKYVHSTISSNTCLDVGYVDERGEALSTVSAKQLPLDDALTLGATTGFSSDPATPSAC